MKKMKNLLAAVVIALGTFGYAQAQTIDAGANIGLGIPFSDLGDVYDPGFSWNIFGLYHFNDQISAGLEIGASTFTGSVEIPFFGTQDLSFTLTEVLVVGNYVFLDNGELRLGGGLGAGIFANDGSEIGISPRVFAQYMVTDNIGLSAQIPVNILFIENADFNYAVIRVGGFYRLDL